MQFIRTQVKQLQSLKCPLATFQLWPGVSGVGAPPSSDCSDSLWSVAESLFLPFPIITTVYFLTVRVGAKWCVAATFVGKTSTRLNNNELYMNRF